MFTIHKILTTSSTFRDITRCYTSRTIVVVWSKIVHIVRTYLHMLQWCDACVGTWLNKGSFVLRECFSKLAIYWRKLRKFCFIIVPLINKIFWLTLSDTKRFGTECYLKWVIIDGIKIWLLWQQISVDFHICVRIPTKLCAVLHTDSYIRVG